MKARSPSWILLVLAACFGAASIAETATPRRAPVTLTSPVQDKNFYLLSLLERTPEVKTALESDVGLGPLARGKTEALHKAATSCPAELSCLTAPFRLTEAEASAAGSALRRLYRTNDSVQRMTDETLRASGMYVRYHSRNGEELLASAWADAVRGLNRIMDVYGEGKAPRYPEIDSASFDVKTQGYRQLAQLVHTVAANLDDQSTELRLFFQPSLRFAMDLLRINRRDEAGRHEPMELGENQAVANRIPSIPWDDYPYTVIVVPGSGSDRITWSLSPAAELRAEIAARRFREKKAPLVLVSGGYVHPTQTPFSEAIEMKKVLIQLGVPADAVIIDPHARHTTTNLRNAARLMYRYGVPFERKALITTDTSQSTYIEGEVFQKRCVDELGYQPHRLLGRTSVFDLEFLPQIDSLQIDPDDPLDP